MSDFFLKLDQQERLKMERSAVIKDRWGKTTQHGEMAEALVVP